MRAFAISASFVTLLLLQYSSALATENNPSFERLLGTWIGTMSIMMWEGRYNGAVSLTIDEESGGNVTGTISCGDCPVSGLESVSFEGEITQSTLNFSVTVWEGVKPDSALWEYSLDGSVKNRLQGSVKRIYQGGSGMVSTGTVLLKKRE